jgi:hypothetical protein
VPDAGEILDPIRLESVIRTHPHPVLQDIRQLSQD